MAHDSPSKGHLVFTGTRLIQRRLRYRQALIARVKQIHKVIQFVSAMIIRWIGVLPKIFIETLAGLLDSNFVFVTPSLPLLCLFINCRPIDLFRFC